METLLGSVDDLTVFDMTLYSQPDAAERLFGWHPGTGGSIEQGVVAGAVRGLPVSVIVFDGIEHAHARVFETLRSVMALGALRDSHGNEISFQHCVLIMTLNLPPQHDPLRSTSLQSLSIRVIPSDIADKISAFIPFRPLDDTVVQSLLRGYFERIYMGLQSKQIGLRIPSQTYKFLIHHVSTHQKGLSEIPRMLSECVVEPINKMVSDNRISPGDVVEVHVGEIGLTLSVIPQHSKETM